MKKLALLMVPLALGVSATALTACGSGETESKPEEPVSSVVEEVSSAAEPKYDHEINNLTGLHTLSAEAEGKRPIAIMINNIDQSLPQYGISDADVMYETLVEGGITRMMAVYGDYTKIPDVCSVRSCRYYYPILAQGMDAVYLHSGADKTIAVKTLADLGIDHYDTDGRFFERDQNRLNSGYATEHTMMVHGAKIPDALKEDNKRTDLKKDKNTEIFRFRAEGDYEKPGKDEAKTFTIRFSDFYQSEFNYDAATHSYLKKHNGNDHMDQATGKQLAYTNVLSLETDFGVRDAKGHMDVDWKGGDGYYFSEGAYQKIKWEKKTAEDSIKITDENGKEVEVNAGKTFIGITPKGTTVI